MKKLTLKLLLITTISNQILATQSSLERLLPQLPAEAGATVIRQLQDDKARLEAEKKKLAEHHYAEQKKLLADHAAQVQSLEDNHTAQVQLLKDTHAAATATLKQKHDQYVKKLTSEHASDENYSMIIGCAFGFGIATALSLLRS